MLPFKCSMGRILPRQLSTSCRAFLMCQLVRVLFLLHLPITACRFSINSSPRLEWMAYSIDPIPCFSSKTTDGGVLLYSIQRIHSMFFSAAGLLTASHTPFQEPCHRRWMRVLPSTSSSVVDGGFVLIQSATNSKDDPIEHATRRGYLPVSSI